MRRTAYLRWPAPVLAVFLVAGCGVLTSAKLKPATKTLSHGRFVYLANRACAADLRFNRRLKAPTDETSYLKNVRLSIKSGEHLIFVLRALLPPPAEAAAFRRLLAAENGEDLLVNQYFDQFGDLTHRQFNHFVERSKILDRRVNARARKLGLHVCAED
jgi:hypothetical protein